MFYRIGPWCGFFTKCLTAISQSFLLKELKHSFAFSQPIQLTSLGFAELTGYFLFWDYDNVVGFIHLGLFHLGKVCGALIKTYGNVQISQIFTFVESIEAMLR
jgi:hypothetical protein